jgi:hypothetical protein
VEINCHLPITLRITGVPSDDQLAAVGRALTRAVAARLAEAERVLEERHGRRPLSRAEPDPDLVDEPGAVRFVLASLPAPDEDPLLDPFRDVLRQELAAKALIPPPPPPPEPVLPGNARQQRGAVPEVDALAWWRLPRIQDALRAQAERLAAAERARPNPNPAKDVDHYIDMFRIEFVNSLTYILQQRLVHKHKGKYVTVRDLHLRRLAEAEAGIVQPRGHLPDHAAFWAMGVVTQVGEARRVAAEKWRQDIEHAADRFLLLARNQTDFLTTSQQADPVVVYGLPEDEETIHPSAHPDLVQQSTDNPGHSPTVIAFMKALRKVYRPQVLAGNYADHEKHSMSIGDKDSLGKNSFDIFLNAKINEEGFYDRKEAVDFFLAMERASKASRIAWVAYYNDFPVAEEANKKIGKLRVQFSGTGAGGSIHHGPAPYILHIHVNVMSQDTAGQTFVGRPVPKHLDMGGDE